MNILFLGDIVGSKGREIVLNSLNRIRQEYNIDFVVVNGENSAHGKGITYKIYNSFKQANIDCITLGNHAFSKETILEKFELCDDLLFPINHIKYQGNAYKIYDVKGLRICVCIILGSICMPTSAFSQYDAMKLILDKTKNDSIDIYMVDAHFETTAEKRLFAEYFKDKVSIVLGSHTHVQTNDEQILHDKIAYITDVGMCGSYESVLGRDIDELVKRVDGIKTYYTPANGKAMINGVVINISEEDKKVKSIKKINIKEK